MSGGGSVLGEEAVVIMIQDIIQEYLQAELDTLLAAHPTATFTMTAPDTTNGYSTDPTHIPRNRANALQIYATRVEEGKRLFDGPSIQDVDVIVKWHMSARLIEMGSRKRIAGRAITKLLRQHWRAYNTTSQVTNLRAAPDYESDSLRVTSQTPTRGGEHALTGDSIDTQMIRVHCSQKVEAPVTFTPAA